jgi:hypothetical protein
LTSILKRKVIDYYRKINSNKGKAEVRMTFNDSGNENDGGDWLEERVADPFDKTAEDNSRKYRIEEMLSLIAWKSYLKNRQRYLR